MPVSSSIYKTSLHFFKRLLSLFLTNHVYLADNPSTWPPIDPNKDYYIYYYVDQVNGSNMSSRVSQTTKLLTSYLTNFHLTNLMTST